MVKELDVNLNIDESDEMTLSKLSDGSSLILRPMEEIMHDSMMTYAEYVIMERALPRVEDGLKPVQRRILYSMYEMGLYPDKPYRKSASIVGDCLGKYHPHGDTSVYDAMVRMAQSFNTREPLVDGQGNFGTIDGDSAAAMRYTEAKMTPMALELLRDIDKNTVKFVKNYDDRLQEPWVLPGRFPNLLVNGATGIAVGLATNIPPHNLAETIDGIIAYIENPNITLKAMMRIIKGPDFPTGGYAIVGHELEQAYSTGRGKITLRARIHIENLENDRKNIVITELPYQVNKSELLKKILEVKEDKKDLLFGVSQIEDESDKDGMRAVIRVKKDCDPNAVLNVLYKLTDLQKTFSFNMIAIADGRPQQMGLLDIISYYSDYQCAVVLARTKYELQEATERAHILMGLVIAVKNIDEVIKIIKAAATVNDAKQQLRQRFQLSERQAQAILDLQLRRLTKLEIDKLVLELKELEEKIKKLTAIIGSKKLLKEVIIEELTLIKKSFKNPRRSEIVADVANAEVVVHSNDKPHEEFVVGLTHSNTIKRMQLKHVMLSNRTATEKSTYYDTYSQLINSTTGKALHLFTNLGNCYKLDAFDVPEARWRDKGANLIELFPEALPKEKVIYAESVDENYPENDLYFFTSLGMVKRTNWSEYKLLKKVFQSAKLRDDDEIIAIQPELQNSTIMYVTNSGMGLNFDKSDIPLQGRISTGVKGINLSGKDFVVFASQVQENASLFMLSDKGYFKKLRLSDVGLLGRYRKGLKVFDLKGENGKKVTHATTFYDDRQIVMFTADEAVVLETKTINYLSRAAKGTVLKGKRKGVEFVDCALYKSEIDIPIVYSKPERVQKAEKKIESNTQMMFEIDDITAQPEEKLEIDTEANENEIQELVVEEIVIDDVDSLLELAESSEEEEDSEE